MRLYKIELYKLCHKKIFPIGFIVTLSFTFLLFFQNVMSETSTVNDMYYCGFAAVRMDRQITEDFSGVLTDEKIQQIVDRYGFPTKYVQYQGFTDGNFLNKFVMKYASDGYAYDWDDYQIATKALPLAETTLAEYVKDGIVLEYYGGWDYFTSLYAIAMAMVSILTLCVVSTVFSGETQCRVKPLLFTTQEGPGKDVHAKVAAAFTVAIGLWATVTLFALLIHGTLFGWDGLRCLAALVEDYLFSDKLMMQPYGIYLAEVLTINLLGVLELCAITLAVSSRCRSTFSSVCTAALCWIVPLLALYMLRTVLVTLNRILLSEMDQSTLLILVPILSLIFFLLERLIYSAPICMIWEGMLLEINSSATVFTASSVVVILAVGMLLLCAAGAYRRYRS